jgi:hypothetical protein
MKLLNPFALACLAKVFDHSRAVHEHSAHPVKDIPAAVELYKLLDYELVRQFPDGGPAFLIHREQDERIELVSESVPRHEAWAVEHIEAFQGHYRRMLNEPKLIELTSYRLQREDLEVCIFQHEGGGFVQLIWRKTPIFPNLFPGK